MCKMLDLHKNVQYNYFINVQICALNMAARKDGEGEKVMFVFVKGSEGISNKTGKEYQVLTLAQYVEVKGKVKVRLGEFFPEKKVDLSDFDFGDIVKCEFREPEFYGDYPKLISMEMAYQSPYVGLLAKYEAGLADGKAE